MHPWFGPRLAWPNRTASSRQRRRLSTLSGISLATSQWLGSSRCSNHARRHRCRLTIQLRAVPGGSEADVTYSHTSLGAEGGAFVASFTEDYYRKFMHDWEVRLNHYLRHGSALIKR